MLYCKPILSTIMTWYFVTQRKPSSFYFDLQVDFTTSGYPSCQAFSLNILVWGLWLIAMILDWDMWVILLMTCSTCDNLYVKRCKISQRCGIWSGHHHIWSCSPCWSKNNDYYQKWDRWNHTGVWYIVHQQDQFFYVDSGSEIRIPIFHLWHLI